MVCCFLPITRSLLELSSVTADWAVTTQRLAVQSAFTQGSMRESELKEMLGEPLRAYRFEESRNRTSLWFSESPNDGHFRMRSVTLRDGIVVGKHAEFYVD